MKEQDAAKPYDFDAFKALFDAELFRHYKSVAPSPRPSLTLYFMTEALRIVPAGALTPEMCAYAEANFRGCLRLYVCHFFSRYFVNAVYCDDQKKELANIASAIYIQPSLYRYVPKKVKDRKSLHDIVSNAQEKGKTDFDATYAKLERYRASTNVATVVACKAIERDVRGIKYLLPWFRPKVQPDIKDALIRALKAENEKAPFFLPDGEATATGTELFGKVLQEPLVNTQRTIEDEWARQLCNIVLSEFPLALQHIPNFFQTMEMCHIACREDGRALRYAEPTFASKISPVKESLASLARIATSPDGLGNKEEADLLFSAILNAPDGMSAIDLCDELGIELRPHPTVKN